MEEREQALMHFGKLGMKWGRRTAKPTSPSAPKAPGRFSKEARAARKREKILSSPRLLYKNRAKFSQKEIDTAMSKMKWERDLRGLSRDKIASGSQMANSVLGYGTAVVTAYTLYKSPVGQKIEAAVKKAYTTYRRVGP